MMNHAYLMAALMTAALSTGCSQQTQEPQRPKYVFYLILDGCGVNTVLGKEMMDADLKGNIGRDTLCMTSFPVVGVASTYSGTSPITDSAASGTCLASGTKSYNGALGVGMDTIPVYGIAQWAYDAGVPVGVATNVCINHATPGGFYAHQPSRHDYYHVALDAITAGFDFYGGSDFHLQNKYLDRRDSLYQAFRDVGYTLARGYEDYLAKADDAERMVLMQRQEESDKDDFSLPYWIDHQEGQMASPDVLRAQVDFLYRLSEKRGGKGFFLMNEIGGKIDFACHPNDGATAFGEVASADSAVRIAYEFYKQHPSETLILITADHETGGLTLGNTDGGYSMNLGILKSQTCSLDESTRHLQQLRSSTRNRVTWEQVKQTLRTDFGFWDRVLLSSEEEDRLKLIYTRSFVGQMANEENLYSASEPLAAESMRILNHKARLGWTSVHHTAGLVPVYAIGPGSERFSGHNDNSDFARKLAEIAGWKITLKK